MPGNLGRNGGEKQQFLLSTNWGVFIGSQFDYTKMMDEIMDIHDDQEHIWQKDKWYCFQCVEQLMKERLWRWWRERKEQGGSSFISQQDSPLTSMCVLQKANPYFRIAGKPIYA